MKSFLQSYILLPKETNKVVYFYFIFLLPLFYFMTLYPLWLRCVMIVLMIVFYYCYRLGFFDAYQGQTLLWIDFVICGSITLLTGYASIFIFIGWQFPYWTFSKTTFRENYRHYIFWVMITSVIALYNSWSLVSQEWYWIAFGLVFVILSPWISWESEKNNRKIRSLHTDNTRLQSIIKQDERQRIARDLHDSMGQSYSTLALKAELAEKLLDKNPQQARQEIQDIAQTARQHLSMVRNIVHNLQERSIASAMIDISKMIELKDIDLIVTGEESSHQWPLTVQDVMAAVLQEAMTNVIRHSQAKRVWITFDQDFAYILTIQDNGRGFPADIDALSKRGYGVKGIQHRVQEHGGSVQFINDKGGRIHIQIPKEVVFDD